MRDWTKRLSLVLVLLLLVVAVVTVVAACGSDEPATSDTSSAAPAAGEDVKWGEMNSLTGVSAAPAKTLQMGYDEEVAYVNENGGINGGQIESINLDDKSDMSASVAGVTQLLNQDKVSLVIGPFPQMVATAARSISEKAGVPHMLYAPPTLADLAKTDYKWSFLCAAGPDAVADALLVAAKDRATRTSSPSPTSSRSIRSRSSSWRSTTRTPASRRSPSCRTSGTSPRPTSPRSSPSSPRRTRPTSRTRSSS